MIIRGIVSKGRQEAARFLCVDWVGEQLSEKLGYTPFPGTLNLKLTDPDAIEAFRELRKSQPILALNSPNASFCDAALYPALFNGAARCAVLWPQMDGQDEAILELVAPEGLRVRFRLEEGSRCSVEVPVDLAPPAPSRYKAVLFDFEGTLVDFQWKLAEAEEELRGVLVDLGFDIVQFAGDNYATLRTRSISLAGSDELAKRIDERFGEVYDRYDFDALSRWSLKPGARDLLTGLDGAGVKVAIVSNIGRKGLSKALEVLGIVGVVDTIVTRNDVKFAKPSGEGIKWVLGGFGVSPSETLMVGDSMADLLAGRDAGTDVVLLLGGESPNPTIIEAAPDHVMNDLAALGFIL